MLPYITALIFFIALAAVFTPEHFNIFSACFFAILVIEILVVKPSRNQLAVFIIIAAVFATEYITLSLLRPLSSISVYLLLQLTTIVVCYFMLVYKHEIFGKWITRDVKIRLAEGVILKYLKYYGVPLELLALLENFGRVYLNLDVTIVYDNYSWLKVLFAAGLFLLVFELFKAKEERKTLFF